MSNMTEYAKNELDIIGMTEDNPEEMNQSMRKHILHMIEEFAEEGHSGFSASYALGILTKLLAYKPLTPLTGEDNEWMEVGPSSDGKPLYQNKRCFSVFKDSSGGVYDSNGKVFTETCVDEDGEEFESSFSNKDSSVPVTFPYTPKTEYVHVGIRT